MPPRKATPAVAGATPRRSARGESSTPAPSNRASPARSTRASPAKGSRASPAKGGRVNAASGVDEPEDIGSKGSNTYGSKGAAAAGQKAVAGGTSLEEALDDTIVEEEEPEEAVSAPAKKRPGRPGRASASPARTSPKRNTKAAAGAAAAAAAVSAEGQNEVEDETTVTPPANGRRPSPRRQPDILANRPNLRPSARDESDEEEEEEEGEDTTGLQNRANYQVPAQVADHAAGRARPVPNRRQPPARPRPNGYTSTARVDCPAYEEPPSIVLWLLRTYQQRPYLSLLAFVSFVVMLLHLATKVPPVRDLNATHAYRHQVRQLTDPITFHLSSWPWSYTPVAAGANGEVIRRLTAVEKRLDDMASRGELLDESMSKLKDWLPSAIVVNWQGINEYRIPDDFWKALKHKLDEDYKPSKTWDKWIRQNEATTNSYLDSKVKNELDNRRIVTPDDFLDLLKKNYADLAQNINADLNARITALHTRLDTLHADVSSTAIAAAQSALSTALSQLPTTQLKSLTAVNIAHNTDIALKSVNYLSRYLGPIIDPALTSPTSPLDTTNSFPHRSWLNIFGTVAPSGCEHEAFAALMPWNEAGDCWCAAPPPPQKIYPKAEYKRKTKGPAALPKAQLAVIMSRRVIPSAITIEHVPRQGTVDKSSAPKDMELWAEMETNGAYGLAWGAYEGIHGEGSAIPRAQTTAEGLPGYFVKIAEWRYEWGEDGNWVQTQSVQLDLGRLGLSTRKVVVRAESNYGGEQTCFYRVRLHGRTVPKSDVVDGYAIEREERRKKGLEL